MLNTQDTIDVRDIIERYETVENAVTASNADTVSADTLAETLTLGALLDDLKGNGGDEQWRGDWYPVTLIRDSYFTDYAQELIEDCDGIPRNLPDYIAIDWAATARNIRIDYMSCEIDGVTYWYR
jgi:hypothetical protein